MLSQYELMLVLSPQISDEDEKKITDLISKLIKDKGKIINSQSLGKKQLAYPIKKETMGSYLLLTLEFSGKEISSLSKKLHLEDKILRHLLIRKE